MGLFGEGSTHSTNIHLSINPFPKMPCNWTLPRSQWNNHWEAHVELFLEKIFFGYSNHTMKYFRYRENGERVSKDN